MIIDPESPEHPYVQVAAYLREQIRSGVITSRLPSLTNLAEETGLSLNTIARAFRILKDEDLIYTRPGRGTFVRRPGSETPRRP